MADRIAAALVAELDELTGAGGPQPPFEQVTARARARRQRRRAGWVALAAAGVLVTGLVAAPTLSDDGRDVLQPVTPAESPTASAAPAAGPEWVSGGAVSARICRSRFGRCLEVTGQHDLDDLVRRFNGAANAPTSCGGGDPDIVVLRFSYTDGPDERVSVNLDCDTGTASVQGKKGRSLDAGLRAAVLHAAPADFGDPATLAEAFGPAPTYPGRPWTRDGLAVDARELAAAALPSHCSWQAATALSGSALGRRMFIRDPGGALGFRPELKAGFRSGVPVPSDAARTGYLSGRFEVWHAPSDPDAVWLTNTGDSADTERWPAPTEQFGCA